MSSLYLAVGWFDWEGGFWCGFVWGVSEQGLSLSPGQCSLMWRVIVIYLYSLASGCVCALLNRYRALLPEFYFWVVTTGCSWLWVTAAWTGCPWLWQCEVRSESWSCQGSAPATWALLQVCAARPHLALWLTQRKGCVAIFILNLETKAHEVPGSRLLYLIILVAVAINKLKIWISYLI